MLTEEKVKQTLEQFIQSIDKQYQESKAKLREAREYGVVSKAESKFADRMESKLEALRELQEELFPLQGMTWTVGTLHFAGVLPDSNERVDGTREGKILSGTGLGYYLKGDEAPFEYIPTHAINGRAFGNAPFYSEKQCRLFLEEVAELPFDWNRSEEAMKGDPDFQTVGRQTVELFKRHKFKDAAETAGGGAW